MQLTIIIPVYNAERYLEGCLNSVLNQTYKDFELIIVNDGSTDLSLFILENYKSKFSNMKILNQNNAGQSNARNNAIHEASGDYIWFIDADDILPKENCIIELIDKIKEYNFPDILCFNTYVIFECFSKNWTNYYANYETGVLTGKEYSSLCGVIPTGPYSQWFNKEFLLKNNLQFKENIVFEDWFFNLNAFAIADRVVGIPKVYYNYMKRENSTINGQMEYRHLFSEVQIINKVFDCYVKNTFDQNYLSSRLEYEYSFLKKIYTSNNASKQDKINIIKKNISKLKIPYKSNFISERIEKKVFEIEPTLVLENIKTFNLLSFYEGKIRMSIKRIFKK